MRNDAPEEEAGGWAETTASLEEPFTMSCSGLDRRLQKYWCLIFYNTLRVKMVGRATKNDSINICPLCYCREFLQTRTKAVTGEVK